MKYPGGGLTGYRLSGGGLCFGSPYCTTKTLCHCRRQCYQKFTLPLRVSRAGGLNLGRRPTRDERLGYPRDPAATIL
eukprot:9481269-Pyramimonas_sp.AAC.1